MSQEFKRSIMDWNIIQQKIKGVNEQIAPYNKRIKEYKEQAEGLESKILGYMVENRMEKSKIEVGDVIIMVGETSKTESISREYLERKSREFFRDDKMAEKFINYIYSTRTKSLEKCLKRKITKSI